MRSADVRVVNDDSWSTDRITLSGREKLQLQALRRPPHAAGTTTLVQLQSNVFRCPYCNSTDTKLENIFGTTPCRSIRYCDELPPAVRAIQDDLSRAANRRGPGWPRLLRAATLRARERSRRPAGRRRRRCRGLRPRPVAVAPNRLQPRRGKQPPRLTQKRFVAAADEVCVDSDRRIYKLGALSTAPAGWTKTVAAATTALRADGGASPAGGRCRRLRPAAQLRPPAAATTSNRCSDALARQEPGGGAPGAGRGEGGSPPKFTRRRRRSG